MVPPPCVRGMRAHCWLPLRSLLLCAYILLTHRFLPAGFLVLDQFSPVGLSAHHFPILSVGLCVRVDLGYPLSRVFVAQGRLNHLLFADPSPPLLLSPRCMDAFPPWVTPYVISAVPLWGMVGIRHNHASLNAAAADALLILIDSNPGFESSACNKAIA